MYGSETWTLGLPEKRRLVPPSRYGAIASCSICNGNKELGTRTILALVDYETHILRHDIEKLCERKKTLLGIRAVSSL